MIIKLVCVRDVKLGEYNNPMCVPSLGVAQRSFQDEVNRADKANTVYNYPNDFSLYHVGDFDTERGVLDPFDVPVHVCDAVDLKIG